MIPNDLEETFKTLHIFQVADHPELEGKYGCIIDFGVFGNSGWRMYTLVAVLLQYCIPLTVITFCHCHMTKVMLKAKFNS